MDINLNSRTSIDYVRLSYDILFFVNVQFIIFIRTKKERKKVKEKPLTFAAITDSVIGICCLAFG